MAWFPRVPEPELMDDPDEVAVYDAADFSEVNRGFAQRLVALAGPRGRAIDLGTGPASIPLELCAIAPRWQVLGVDYGPRMLAQARRRAREGGIARSMSFLRSDIASLPAHRVGRFDLVFSNSLLHHVRDPIGFWRVAADHVKPGGVLVVQDLMRPASTSRLERLVEKHAADAPPLLRELFRRSLEAAYTCEEIESQLELARVHGCRVETVSDRHVLVAGRPR